MSKTKSKKLKSLRLLRDQGTASPQQLEELGKLEAKTRSSGPKQPRNKDTKRGINRVTRQMRNVNIASGAGGLSQAAYETILLSPGNHARTSAGAAALVVAMHPWSDPAEYSGWPDQASARITTFSYRTNTSIAYNGALFPSPPTNPGLGAIRFLIPPSPEFAFFYQIRDNASGVWSSMTYVREQTFSSIFPGQLDVSWPVMLADLGGSEHRIPAKGFTGIFDAPDLANAGTVYAGQIVPETVVQNLTAGTASVSTTPAISGTNYLFTFPEGTEGLARVDPSMYEQRATQGVALPIKMASEVGAFPFKSAVSGGFQTLSTLASPPVVTAWVKDITWQIQFTTSSTDDAEGPVTFAPGHFVTTPTGVPTGAPSPYSSGTLFCPGASTPSENAWGVVYFEGIQLVSPTGAAATIRVKEVCKPDIRVYGDTAISPSCHPTPVYDPVAVDAVITMQQLMPSAYPASANGFLDFLKSTVNWAATKGKGFLQSALSLIPGVGGLVSEASGPVLDTINGMVNG